MPAPATKSLSRRSLSAGDCEGARQTIRCPDAWTSDGPWTGGVPSLPSPVSPFPASPDAHVQTFRAAVFPTLIDDEIRTFPPEASPHAVIDWPRVGKHCQAARTAAGLGRIAFATLVGVNAHQIGQVEKGLPVSAHVFMRLCVHFGRDQTFFCKTLAGWRPHLPKT